MHMRSGRTLRVTLTVLIWLLTFTVEAADSARPRVIYVPEISVLGPVNNAGLVGYFAERQFKSRMSEQTHALSTLLGGADVQRDLLQAIACPTATSTLECPNLVVVPEASLPEYLKTARTDATVVVRIGAAGIFKKTYQVSVIAAPVVAGAAPPPGRSVNAIYIDWDATADSVKADYAASLREIAAMLDAGVPVASTHSGGGMPAEWESRPRLKTLREKGANRCVKSPVGDRVLRMDESRVWLGSTTRSGLTISSSKWVLCR